MPVFDGLLPAEHDQAIQTLLFTTAEWHTLAKLRLHTDLSLGWLHETTAAFGTQIRRFQKYTCSFFDTKELPRETATCSRRRQKSKASDSAVPSSSTLQTTTPTTPGAKKKIFNLILIKLHALGDYVPTIKMFGTSDSYSTQPVRLLVWVYYPFSFLIDK